MAIVYRIYNDINDKNYIGKTTYNIKKRWREHRNDSKRRILERRPLYAAMRKYGVDKFHIEILEECSVQELENREIYWINYYNSYYSGYNATKGGDGKFHVNHEHILKLWNEGYTISQIHTKLQVDRGTISHSLKNAGVSSEDIKHRGIEAIKQKVYQIDKKTGIILAEFDSTCDACIYLHGNISGNAHIVACCKGKRKSAYGYKWKYSNN